MIADQLNLNKEKVEISASICKVDLLSDLVGEYPELQGILGSYFAKVQGFDDDISLAIKEHYLPLGLDSKIPKKLISVAVSIVDKVDTLVGFFGIDEIKLKRSHNIVFRVLSFYVISMMMLTEL